MSRPVATPAMWAVGVCRRPVLRPTPPSIRNLGLVGRPFGLVFPSGNLSGPAPLISVSAFHAAARSEF